MLLQVMVTLTGAIPVSYTHLFATRNSQSVMAGCNWWWTQTPATVQENDVERIIISKSAAKELVVGGTVSIGNASSLTSDSKPETDRGNTGLNAKANRVRITKIEDYDDNSSAVYVDNGCLLYTSRCV